MGVIALCAHRAYTALTIRGQTLMKHPQKHPFKKPTQQHKTLADEP
jgi:hypothetical protein